MRRAAALDGLDNVLDDIGISHAELDRMIKGPADLGTQFETMAEMAHTALSRVEPAARRQAVWVCVHCTRRVACKRWLRTGVWRDGSDMRCPNAALFHD